MIAFSSARRALILVALLAGTTLVALAQTIPNPSFETNPVFTNFPGYLSGNNTTITGWTTNNPARVGLNPGNFGGSGNSPFADNSVPPNGARVAFIQSIGGETNTLGTTITGLTVGTWYRVQFRANARIGTSLTAATYKLNGGAEVAFAAPAGAYSTINAIFQATATKAALEIGNSTTSDSTLLVDNFTITAATPIVVTNSSDAAAGSLRAALATANSGANATNFNVITFAAALNGQTIALLSELAVNDPGGVAIDASALTSGIKLDGNSNIRVFSNAAGSILALRQLTIARGAVSGNGGGISNSGRLAMTQCTVNNCFVPGEGAGICGVAGSDSFLDRCTISNNNADVDGGGILSRGNMALRHCTVADNFGLNGSGGLHISAGTTRLENTIVAGNDDPNSSQDDIEGSGGTVTLDGVNLIGVQSSGYASVMPVGSPNVNGDYVGSTSAALNAQLFTLNNNGGPTQTRAIATTSPARNAAVGSTITTDQRGLPVVGTPDIGAFEMQGTSAFTLSATTYSGFEGGVANVDINRGTNVSGITTVRLFTTNVTAGAADFTARANTTASDVTILDGETVKTVAIPLTGDSLAEADETFTVTLGSATPAGATIGSPSTATVTIHNAIIVTTNADSGTGSLRDALTNLAPGLPGANVIGFAPSKLYYAAWARELMDRVRRKLRRHYERSHRVAAVPQSKASTAAVKPNPQATHTVLAEYEESCDELLTTVATVSGLNTHLRYSHPWFGPLNAAGWHALSGGHLRIHRVQIERILAGVTTTPMLSGTR